MLKLYDVSERIHLVTEENGIRIATFVKREKAEEYLHFQEFYLEYKKCLKEFNYNKLKNLT